MRASGMNVSTKHKLFMRNSNQELYTACFMSFDIYKMFWVVQCCCFSKTVTYIYVPAYVNVIRMPLNCRLLHNLNLRHIHICKFMKVKPFYINHPALELFMVLHCKKALQHVNSSVKTLSAWIPYSVFWKVFIFKSNASKGWFEY